MKVTFFLNGVERTVESESNRTLLDLLRTDFGLTGTKYGCGIGQCGTCTVMINGQAKNACLTLVGQVEGFRIVTVEGLAEEGRLHPLQQAFIEKNALQCGYCTPGMLMSAKALLDRKPSPSEDEIRVAIAGNLCRCTGYTQIVDAIRLAAEKMKLT